MVTKNCPTVGEHVIIFMTWKVTIATVCSAKKKTFNYSFGAYNSKTALENFDKQDKTQLFHSHLKVFKTLHTSLKNTFSFIGESTYETSYKHFRL